MDLTHHCGRSRHGVVGAASPVQLKPTPWSDWGSALSNSIPRHGVIGATSPVQLKPWTKPKPALMAGREHAFMIPQHRT
ncbi:hypothetical protein TIFTF001_039064 [Ficus carica]|uniref:Uncharacterized protein n=1 Tax=Ficus carica TaxID=3494 RepID=A0AA88E8H8_FICCA|nr:hypothetical protein TIFTF001_039064 [Ficus carica]